MRNPKSTASITIYLRIILIDKRINEEKNILTSYIKTQLSDKGDKIERLLFFWGFLIIINRVESFKK